MDDVQDKQYPRGKPLTDILGELENGAFLREVTEKLYNISHAVRETRKKGKLKLTLNFTPTGKGSVQVDAEYVSDEPEHDRPSTIFFQTPDGTMLRDDPAQPKLPLRAVPDNNDAAPRTVYGDANAPLRKAGE